MSDLELRSLLLPPYDNNCYVLACPETGESLIVDAPSSVDRILDLAAGTRPACIVITHNHRDHWGALEELKAQTAARLAVHPDDAGSLPIGPDVPLEDGQVLPVGNGQVRVIHTPGHTPGSVCLLAGRHLVTGDTLFPNGPGNTRTPQDLDRTIASITAKLFVLPDDLEVHPGHGSGTVLGAEKQLYAAFAARPRDPALCGDVLWVP